MKITSIEDLHADAGSRNFSFVKVTTDEGLVGWSEYTETVGNMGVTAAIRRFGDMLIGADPTRVEHAMAVLYTKSIPVWSGIAAHARAAIGNALLDVKAKQLGVPVSALFGGKVRDKIPVYWSHFAGARIQRPEECNLPPVRSYKDLEELAAEAAERGYKGLKMNVFLHDGQKFTQKSPGHGVGAGYPELNPDPEMAKAAIAQIEAMRRGAGDDMPLMIDLNYNFKLEGFIKICRALEDHGLEWAELDCYDPDALAYLRKKTTTTIASGESLYARQGYKPYFDNYAMDVAVVDVIWNGFLESVKIAAMAEAYELNVAPHNFYGYLGDHISGHFAASVPNFRIMELEVDDVPWRGEFFTHAPVIENGEFHIPDRPGWGTDVIEAAVKKHPPRN